MLLLEQSSLFSTTYNDASTLCAAHFLGLRIP